MNMRQARRSYRRTVAANRAVFGQDAKAPISMSAYARRLCVGDIHPVGKLAKICAAQARAGLP